MVPSCSIMSLCPLPMLPIVTSPLTMYPQNIQCLTLLPQEEMSFEVTSPNDVLKINLWDKDPESSRLGKVRLGGSDHGNNR